MPIAIWFIPGRNKGTLKASCRHWVMPVGPGSAVLLQEEVQQGSTSPTAREELWKPCRRWLDSSVLRRWLWEVPLWRMIATMINCLYRGGTRCQWVRLKLRQALCKRALGDSPCSMLPTGKDRGRRKQAQEGKIICYELRYLLNIHSNCFKSM